MSARPTIDLGRRLTELARLRSDGSPIVSVYLNTRWADEQQRDRVRLFLKNELRRAREGAGGSLAEDLDWVETEGRLLVEGALVPEANGVALFACQPLGLREVIPVRVSFDDAFVVTSAPWLRPFAAVLEETRPALVAFVDGQTARLLPLEPHGRGEELILEHAVEGRHATGGWAGLAQSRYQRHVEAQRDQHFEAVAEILTDLVDRQGITRVVLAGEARALASLRRHLPPPIDGRVVGLINGTRHEPTGILGARAAELLTRLDQAETARAVDAVLGDAAAGARAVAGLAATLEAVHRNNVQRLFLLKDFQASGRVCTGCEMLDVGADGPCSACGAATRSIEMGGTMVDRVMASGGTADVVVTHAGLAAAGRIAARLRY
jgi:hypothetical protein